MEIMSVPDVETKMFLSRKISKEERDLGFSCIASYKAYREAKKAEMRYLASQGIYRTLFQNMKKI